MNRATNSRDAILNRIAQNKPADRPLPDVAFLHKDIDNPAAAFTDMLTTIGGTVFRAKNMDYVRFFIGNHSGEGLRNITTVPYLADAAELITDSAIDPHSLQDVNYAFIEAKFGVAENGALWVTEDMLALRALPFICQHLAVILNEKDIVATMHAAYNRIGDADYGYGAFIAGPSKTADIEQSLVLGAHGPRSMTVFLVS